MSDTDQKLENAVLKRMLETPPTPHKEKQTMAATGKRPQPKK